MTTHESAVQNGWKVVTVVLRDSEGLWWSLVRVDLLYNDETVMSGIRHSDGRAGFEVLAANAPGGANRQVNLATLGTWAGAPTAPPLQVLQEFYLRWFETPLGEGAADHV